MLRALDRLTHGELWVLHALVAGIETPDDELPDDDLHHLCDLALVWESSSGFRPLTVVTELLAHQPPEPKSLPDLLLSDRDEEIVSRAAAGAAFDAVRRIELLLDTWGTTPPAVLRSGGLAVRDLKATALLLQVEERSASFLVELAATAGLLAQASPGDLPQSWLPTDAYDAWARHSYAERWRDLATAWLTSPRVSGLVGAKDASGKSLNTLAPGLVDPHCVDTRTLALEQLAQVPAGKVLATGTGVASLVSRVRWLRPRRPGSLPRMTAWAIEEAAQLGVTGLGGLSGFGRHLVAGAPDDAVKALDPLLPEPLDHVLVQGDLTAIAPGPLESSLASRLQLVADVESRGGATVHRFSAGSVRRALDAGWSAHEIHAFLESISRTPIPQALTYLVDDTARTFGSLRVGYAEAFLRTDDEAELEALLRSRAASTLGLRRIAPTVLISTTPIEVLLPRLREMGAAPVIEADDGTVHVARPDVHRARTPKQGSRGREAAREAAQVSHAVTAVRAGDKARALRPEQHVATTPADSLALLRAAVEAGTSVWIGYLDNHGTASERVVEPVRVESGQLTAYDPSSDDERTFAIHRITGVRHVSSGQT